MRIATRMHGKSGEFFPDFFDLKISINQIFFSCKEVLEVVSGQCIICITLRSVSQFLDESSNLRTGCKKDTIHDAFDAIYVSCIHNSSYKFLCNFFHSRPVMVAIIRSLPPEPAVLCTRALRERRWMGR